MTVIERLIVRGRSVLRMHGAAEDNVAGIPDGTLRLYNDGTSAYIQVYSRATGAWHRFDDSAAAAVLYAPIAADYLVGTANGTLTGEIVAGTAPGGELGGTWASPTVDATHSGSAHHAESHTVPSHSGTPGGELGGTWTTPTVDATHSGSAHHAEAHTVPSHTGTPGGELGGTWTTPTVDATHSGSAHHAQSHTVASHSDTSGTGAELNTLTDGSNADSLHSHLVGPTTVAKTADETVNSSTTYQDDNHLTFAVAANTVYAVTGIIMYNSGATPDIKFQWSVPASAKWSFAANGSLLTTEAPWADDSGPDLRSTGATVNFVLSFTGVITVAGTSGSATLQWAQNTSDAGNTTVKDGSRITYEAVS